MADVTFYFNSHSTSAWLTPANLDDGSTATFATRNVNNSTHVFSSNTCDGTDLGTITQVQVRQFGKLNSSTIRADFTPTFAAGDGTRFDWGTWMTTTADYSTYNDITSDTNAPTSWAWSDVQGLTGTVTCNRPVSGNASIAIFEILVTYTVPDSGPGFDGGHGGRTYGQRIITSDGLSSVGWAH